jgi:hypothetical protein
MSTVDWGAVAKSIGVSPDQGGSVAAQAAICGLLGEDALREAVDWYVAGKPGAELARSVLWQLHPPSAMRRCKELIEESSNSEVRASAVELLRVVADARVLEWVPGFLADAQCEVQEYGVLIVDQLAFSLLVSEEQAEPVLLAAETSSNAKVREYAARIRTQYLKRAGREP